MNTLHSLIVAACLGMAGLGFATAVVAADPPPGHPSPDAAMRMMQPGGNDGSLRTGQVISHIDANEYTYVEVNEAGKNVWLAAPKTAVKDGDAIRFANGMVMRDFYSKLLKRTFPEVIFTGSVEVTATN
jgi:hypothetical protein